MRDLTTFFEEPDLSMGVFYPKHYIIATFPRYSGAEQAMESLRHAGVSEHDAVLATGDEVLSFFHRLRAQAGFWGAAMRSISRLLDTEASFADKDIQRAEEGAGFLAIHSPTERDTDFVKKLLEPFKPSSMEWYLPGGIRSLV